MICRRDKGGKCGYNRIDYLGNKERRRKDYGND